jgi:hypothetical protein
VAALPPQPPGSQPPQPPGVTPPGATPPSTTPATSPPAGPPQAPYPGGAYTGQMPSLPYGAQPAAVVPVKVHKRTFFLTLAQTIIILKAILTILIGLGIGAIGVYILVAGHAAIANIPGYTQYQTQFGNAFITSAGYLFIVIGLIPLIIGIIDIVLGIVVGRPSNVARWIIIVLDVLSIILALADFGRVNTSTGDLIVVVYLILQVIVLYALLLDPPTRRNFAGTAT